MKTNPKIKSLPELKRILGTLRRKKKKIVFTNGCFDILHRGHIQYLRKAKSFGDVLVIGLNSDGSVRKIKGRGRPVNTQADRAEVLSGLEDVDYVTVFTQDTPLELIRQLRPDVLVKGADWKKDQVVGRAVVEARGGRVRLVKYLKGYSTTGFLTHI